MTPPRYAVSIRRTEGKGGFDVYADDRPVGFISGRLELWLYAYNAEGKAEVFARIKHKVPGGPSRLTEAKRLARTLFGALPPAELLRVINTPGGPPPLTLAEKYGFNLFAEA